MYYSYSISGRSLTLEVLAIMKVPYIKPEAGRKPVNEINLFYL